MSQCIQPPVGGIMINTFSWKGDDQHEQRKSTEKVVVVLLLLLLVTAKWIVGESFLVGFLPD